jgi:hypothetical protein
MSVRELRAALVVAGVGAAGAKADLVERLRVAWQGAAGR